MCTTVAIIKLHTSILYGIETMIFILEEQILCHWEWVCYMIRDICNCLISNHACVMCVL